MSRAVQDSFSITDVDEAILREYLDNRIHDIHTAQPAEVISINEQNTFNGQERTVGIRLGVRRDLSGLSTKVPPLLYVPIVYPANKNFGMTWPISVGDTGLAVFSETSIDHWWLDEEMGQVVNPRDIRMHEYTDAFFIPHVMQRAAARQCPEIDDEHLCVFAGQGDNQVKIKLKDDGTFCIETKNGEFLDVLTQALQAIATNPLAPNGALGPIIQTITGMKC